MPVVVPPVVPPALGPRQGGIGSGVDRILLVGVFGPRSVSLGSNQRERCRQENCFHNQPLCVSCLLQTHRICRRSRPTAAVAPLMGARSGERGLGFFLL